jgi:hypothetical protein
MLILHLLRPRESIWLSQTFEATLPQGVALLDIFLDIFLETLLGDFLDERLGLLLDERLGDFLEERLGDFLDLILLGIFILA